MFLLLLLQTVGRKVLIIAFASANISNLIATRFCRNRSPLAGIAEVELLTEMLTGSLGH